MYFSVWTVRPPEYKIILELLFKFIPIILAINSLHNLPVFEPSIMVW